MISSRAKLLWLSVLPSVAQAHILLNWNLRIPTVAYNFRFSDAKVRALIAFKWWSTFSESTNSYLSGRPYYYNRQDDYRREQLDQQANSSTIILPGLMAVHLLEDYEDDAWYNGHDDALDQYVGHGIEYVWEDDSVDNNSTESYGEIMFDDDVAWEIYEDHFWDEDDNTYMYKASNDDFDRTLQSDSHEETANNSWSGWMEDDAVVGDDTYHARIHKSPRAQPNFLVAPFHYDEDGWEAIEMIVSVANAIDAHFVILVLQDNSWKASIRWWWTGSLPPLDQYLQLRLSLMNSLQPMSDSFFVVVPSRQEEIFLQQLLYPGGILGFSLSDSSSSKGRDGTAIFIVVAMVMGYACRWIFQGHTSSESSEKGDSSEFHLVPFTSEDLGRGEIHNPGTEVDHCAICLEAMPTKTSVCVLPCRHAFHPRCMDEWLQERKTTAEEEATWDGTREDANGRRFFCPLCKFDLRQHLLEHRAARAELSNLPVRSRLELWLGSALWHWRRRMQDSRSQQVLLEDSRGEGGDLELTLEDRSGATATGRTEVNLVV